MVLSRWEPFREIETMQRQMSRLLDQISAPSETTDIISDRITFVPPAELEETSDDVKLWMEIPGIDPQDLDVKVAADTVSVTGERKSEVREEEKRGMRRSEFRYGRFQRVIPLPSRIQNDKVQADFKNGVLCLTMPKAEEEKTRVVTVQLPGQSQQGQISGGQQG
ncbi:MULTISPECIES: Hsp20/alpha crystallin family protein [Cyanophyceae]|uniref:Hsp20/alpha crystallin family protein n=1 Tax=Cyanophyceae TaxID=3028117 RepID=UPI00232E63AF|nr:MULTISPECIES: Hsp20/alpha crystallin family protein [Cyanophyceae]MDB9303332.1 Hsp20/alpha crystallin family protein [Nodularia spumigena CS-591/12]MDB9318722.1 Hsp20/alpha crystallin family protein [Nodularia spumigena CS-590/01A]MDB9321272.1 Hsp20/alpha crystallin family protein [Nodularia spumigena CS-591/07A]MDB9328501.1 Hsp20/alpha crystallin family protein [Nodularia spumigena CS-590/02]MDB9331195.1 Hsp20/alpha crystallin family protein [Nodularia spumigena CS-591/04]